MKAVAPKAGAPRLTIQLVLLIVALIIAALAFEVIRRLVRDLQPTQLRSAIVAIQPWRVEAAFLLTMGSYVAMSFYDLCGFRIIGRKLTWRQTGLTAFSSYAISNNLGLALITGGSTRYVHYSRMGFSASEVARVALLSSAAFWTALLTLCGAVLLTGPRAGKLPLPPPLDVNLALIGAVLLVVVALGWTLFCGVLPVRRWLLGGQPIRLLAILALQVVALVDVLLAASALLTLFASGAGELQRLAFAYALGIVVGVASHVPGGLGVFEATFLSLGTAAKATALAALLLYRVIYYIIPFTLALAIQAVTLAPRIGSAAQTSATAAVRMGRATIPATAALLAGLAGAVLLFSIATPAVPHRMAFVEGLVPPVLITTSHLLTSLIGTLLLLLGPALYARLRSALLISTSLMIAGGLLCFIKGIDFEEGVLLVLAAAFLQMNSNSFYRNAGIGTAPLGALWWGAILAVMSVACTVLLVTQFRALANVAWWSIEFGHEASRSARALIAAIILLGAIGVRQLLTAPAKLQTDHVPNERVFTQALSGAERSDALLALTGDKQILVAPEGDAFLMYRVHRRTWVVMGDPVGNPDRWAALAWGLRETAYQEAGLVCFYQVSSRMLPILIDLGLMPIKCGEEALVDTRSPPQFGRSTRAAIRKAERNGLEFLIIPREEVRQHFAALKEVSDDWLRTKAGGEKSFSLGRFDADYLSNFDCAAVCRGQTILAFANLWQLPNRREASVDLMRQRKTAPNGTMEFLISKCITRAFESGFQRFSLGVAPLSGLSSRALAPRWARLGGAIYSHGELLYGFRGLRQFKQKFGPQWESRYLGTHRGWRGWLSLLDTARLISD